MSTKSHSSIYINRKQTSSIGNVVAIKMVGSFSCGLPRRKRATTFACTGKTNDNNNTTPQQTQGPTVTLRTTRLRHLAHTGTIFGREQYNTERCGTRLHCYFQRSCTMYICIAMILWVLWPKIVIHHKHLRLTLLTWCYYNSNFLCCDKILCFLLCVHCLVLQRNVF